MAEFKLPLYEDIEHDYAECGTGNVNPDDLNSLDKFIWENEPATGCGCKEWRAELEAAIRWVINQKYTQCMRCQYSRCHTGHKPGNKTCQGFLQRTV
jgi:hypothetical protein